MFYVCPAGRPGEARDEDDFYASGAGTVEHALKLAPPVARAVALEIGCGIGRNLFALAQRFESAIGVDVAAQMVERANASPRRPSNARALVGSGSTLDSIESGSVDFALCVVVLQHIEHWPSICSYLREIGRVLRPGASAALHFDTRRNTLGRRLYLALPDALLSPHHRRGMRRHPRTPGAVRTALDQAGLAIVAEQGVGTDDHWFGVRLAADPDPRGV